MLAEASHGSLALGHGSHWQSCLRCLGSEEGGSPCGSELQAPLLEGASAVQCTPPGAVDAASHPDGLWFVTVSFTESAVGTASCTRVTVCGANLRRARWLSARPASQLRGEPAAPACWRSARPAPPPPAAGQLPPSLAWTRCRLTGSPLLSLVLPSRSLVAGVFSLLTCTRIFPPQCLCVSSSVPRVPAEGVPSDFIRAEQQTKSRFVAVPPSSQLTVLGRPHAAHGPSGLGRWSVG